MANLFDVHFDDKLMNSMHIATPSELGNNVDNNVLYFADPKTIKPRLIHQRQSNCKMRACCKHATLLLIYEAEEARD